MTMRFSAQGVGGSKDNRPMARDRWRVKHERAVSNLKAFFRIALPFLAIGPRFAGDGAASVALAPAVSIVGVVREDATARCA
jgi:hypothetical protein